MTSTTFQNQLLRQLTSKKSNSKNIIQKGFTLVELMVVIVIVGVLSAVALPQFLNQSQKAKLTEPQGIISAGLKKANIEYHENNKLTGQTCSTLGVADPRGSDDQLWTYACTATPTTMSITATGTAKGLGTTVNTGAWVLDATSGQITKGDPAGLS